jgi:hypothetical protein
MEALLSLIHSLSQQVFAQMYLSLALRDNETIHSSCLSKSPLKNWDWEKQGHSSWKAP